VLVPSCLLLVAGEPFIPDRADVSSSTILVEPGSLQIEAGVDVEMEDAIARRNPVAPVLAIRLGVHPRAELRFFEGDPLHWGVAESDEEPHLAFGAKIRLFDGDAARWVPAVGLQPVIISRRPAGTWRGDVPMLAMVLIVSQPLGRWVGVDINAGPRADPALALQHTFSGLLSASFGFNVHERVLLYAESYGIVAHRDVAAAGFTGGAIFTVVPKLALDIGGRGTVAGAPSYAVMIGITGLYEGRRGARRRLSRAAN
jgi:hypothetical protein